VLERWLGEPDPLFLRGTHADRNVALLRGRWTRLLERVTQ
jgi:hypothetical protein